ncbi:family A1 protease [Exidia glandulosa HHB12029]|uniref:Family A1 protease n=1 Tax=Exidia glandulosa HHB12029 TaxID=1314781 RepID=A0A165H2A8_EXIGL|nr:family A1 protease [Exidia glandulosa HHB12029]
MAPFTSFVLAAVCLASTSLAAPSPVVSDKPVSATFTKQINRGNLKGLLARDQARAKALLRKSSNSPFSSNAVISVPATNEAVTYLAAVQVGSPATTFNLIIDTGSSNTWVGATTPFRTTSTSVNTGRRVAVQYGSGDFSGTEFTDRVALGSSLVIPSQSIGVASTSEGFDGVDGILGIGPVDLTAGTVSGVSTVPTVTDNLFRQGTITSNLVAVSFNPTTSDEITNGELTFGGTDSSKFSGTITFAPITGTSPANEFWGINQVITLGSTSILASTAGIVDTGTTLTLIATNAFTRYRSATGGVLDRNTGLIRFTQAQFNALQPLNFVIAGRTFALTANAQLWPRSLNVDIGGVANNIYGIVNDLGTNSGEGLDFINGQTFLERFYSVFDTTNRRVGFATTPFTNSTSN